MEAIRMTAIKGLAKRIDLSLLIFLLLFLDVKLVVKLVAILFIYICYHNIKTNFRVKNSRLPLFYPAIIVIAVANYFILGLYAKANYFPVLATGIIFWVACIVAIHQIKLAVDRNTIEVLENTLLLFFLLNACFSLANLLMAIIDSGAINPYRYQGQYQKYFIGTGDYIKGVTFDTSTTNAIINAFGVVYFLEKRKTAMLMLSMCVLLLTGSNFTNIILVCTFGCLFIFRSTKNQKSLMVACGLLLAVFMGKISPQNNDYIDELFSRYVMHKMPSPARPVQTQLINQPDSLLTSQEKKKKQILLYFDSLNSVNINKDHPISPAVTMVKPEIPTPSIHSRPFQHIADTTTTQWHLLAFIQDHHNQLSLSSANYASLPQPGKVIALNQTKRFLRDNPLKLLTGDGTGNFSSKLAFRATALDVSGGYPTRLSYINNDFLKNHLDVYLYYFTQNSGAHSLINNTGSVYDQLISEYGLIGIALFFIGYLWFFLKRYKLLTYGLSIIIILAGACFVEYWFEQLSVVVLAELMLFMNLKENVNLPANV